MLNEERIKMMARMASYENDEGKKNGAIGSYFRSDYIALQVVKSIVYATLSYLLVCGALILYNFDMIMDHIYELDLIAIARKAVIAYIVVTIIYAVISYIVYSYKYSKAKKGQKAYVASLRQLSKVYQNESGT